MADGRRDIRLLAALTNKDNSEFQRIIENLEIEARGFANAILNPVDAEEAVEKAINKATDWLQTDEPFTKHHLMAHIKKLINNAIIDYVRTNKVVALPEHDIRGELALIDERLGYFGDDEAPNEPTGWHGVKIAEPARAKTVVIEPYSRNHWLNIIFSLTGFQSWLLPYSTDLYWPSVNQKLVKIKSKDTDRMYNSAKKRRWAQYELIMALVEAIPGMREQQIFLLYLRGYNQKQIGSDFAVSKPYISKVVNRWLKSWGWDNHQTDNARIIILTHALACIYSTHLRAVEKIRKQEEQRRLTPIRRQFLAIERGGDAQDQFFERLKQEEKERADKARRTELTLMFNPGPQTRGKYNPTANEQRRLRWAKITAHQVYEKTIADPRTKPCFHNLQESDSGRLEGVCHSCYLWWFGFTTTLDQYSRAVG